MWQPWLGIRHGLLLLAVMRRLSGPQQREQAR
jgi:hypothetical protein